MEASHPAGRGPGVGGSCGGLTVGCVGRGFVGPATGGRPGLVGSPDGLITGPGGIETSSANGDSGVVGRSVNVATHSEVGSPTVPGGQVHTGRWSFTLQSAFVPQTPRAHTS